MLLVLHHKFPSPCSDQSGKINAHKTFL